MATLGSDGHDYRARLEGLGMDLSCVRSIDHNYTAQAIIITDESNNQITAFHPGAMGEAHLTPVPTHRQDIRLAIIAPDGRDAMMVHAQQLHAAGIPFIFDPGQGLPMFNGDELKAFVQQASWVAVNDYEARMLSERTGQSIEALSRSHLRGVVVTLGSEGCEVWIQGTRTHVPGHQATAIVDPTGCGDAFRAALLYGLERDWPLQRCVELGNRIGAIKIAHRGGQNHPVDRVALGLH
jgi:adenosine kinase